MAEYGHLKISRKAYAKDPFWIEPRVFSRWEAWEDLIQRAAWKPHRRMVQGTLIILRRGQLLASERFLADAWQWSRGRVRRFLSLLEEMERINLDTAHAAAHHGALITLCNYNVYQSAENIDSTTHDTDDATNPSTNPGPPAVPTADQREGSISRIESKEMVESRDTGESAAPAEAPPPDAIAAMEKLVDTAADQVETKTDRTRLVGELRMIVSGDDVTAWQDATGTRVPWTDRPRLLRLALQRWYLDRDQYPNPRSALRYVVAQQYDPHQLPKGSAPSPGSEAAKYDRHTEPQHYQDHQTNGSRRGQQELHRFGEEPDEAQVDRDLEDQRSVDRWVAEHPDDAQALLDQVNEDVKADVGEGPATGTMVRVEFKRRVLELLRTVTESP